MNEVTRGYRIHINLLNGIINHSVYICTKSERSSFTLSRSLRIEVYNIAYASNGELKTLHKEICTQYHENMLTGF